MNVQLFYLVFLYTALVSMIISNICIYHVLKEENALENQKTNKITNIKKIVANATVFFV